MSYSSSSVSYTDPQEPATSPSAATSSSSGGCSKAAAELKIYQAFIFSIPVFFTFILLFLFYLFYLRRRRVDWSSLRMRNSRSSFHSSESDESSRAELGLKKEVREMLPIIVYKESFSVTDTLCSVCLGDYQAEEKLQQIPACGHTFHMDCIDNWLSTHATCPLCRQSILVSTKSLSEASDVESERDEGFSRPHNGGEASAENGSEHCEDNHQQLGEMSPEGMHDRILTTNEEAGRDSHNVKSESNEVSPHPHNGKETSHENGSEHCGDNHQQHGETSPENMHERILTTNEEAGTDSHNVESESNEGSSHPHNGTPENGSEHLEESHQEHREMPPENMDGSIPTTHEADTENVEMVRKD